MIFLFLQIREIAGYLIKKLHITFEHEAFHKYLIFKIAINC